MTVLSIAVLVV